MWDAKTTPSPRSSGSRRWEAKENESNTQPIQETFGFVSSSRCDTLALLRPHSAKILGLYRVKARDSLEIDTDARLLDRATLRVGVGDVFLTDYAARGWLRAMGVFIFLKTYFVRANRVKNIAAEHCAAHRHRASHYHYFAAAATSVTPPPLPLSSSSSSSPCLTPPSSPARGYQPNKVHVDPPTEFLD